MKKMWRPIDTRFFLVWLAFGVGSFIALTYGFQMLLLYRVLISTTAATFALFGFDKFQAIQKGERVPEKILYLATFFGGSVGSLIGMNLFRHKTSKTSFQFVVIVLILIQIGLIVFLVGNRIDTL